MSYNIALSKIDVEKFSNPRTNITEASTKELAKSIDEQGQLQPVGVLKIKKDRYALVYGFRRFAAVQSLGRTVISCHILPSKTTHSQVPLLQLAENLARESLSRLDDARAYAAAKQEGVAVSVIAQSIGRTKSYVSQVCALLSYHPSVVSALDRGDITFTDARKLGEIADTSVQAKILSRALAASDRLYVTAARKVAERADKAGNAAKNTPSEDTDATADKAKKDTPKPPLAPKKPTKAAKKATTAHTIKVEVDAAKKAGKGKDSSRKGSRPGRKKGKLVIAPLDEETDRFAADAVASWEHLENLKLTDVQREQAVQLVRFGCFAGLWAPLQDATVEAVQERFGASKEAYHRAKNAKTSKTSKTSK